MKQKESDLFNAETSALLEGARAILEHHDFQASARIIFDQCNNLIGSTSGYVALLSDDGKENEVLFLEAGGEPCTVDPSLPMPIRGLRGDVYKTAKAAFDNDFSNSTWMKYMPDGHMQLKNVLFAPMNLRGKVVGLLGVANKPTDFTKKDAQIATKFGELAAIALQNSLNLESIEHSEEHLRSIVETASDAIIVIDQEGKIISWNDHAEKMFDYTSEEIVGRDLTNVMPERYRDAHKKGLIAAVKSGTLSSNKVYEATAVRRDGTEFFVELSLGNWESRGKSFFTGIIRDITERRKADLELQKYAHALEKANEKTLALYREIEQKNRELNKKTENKTEFLRHMGHEIRTPINSIITLADLLACKIDGDLTAEQSKQVNMIKESTNHLLTLVNDLLDLSRIEAGVIDTTIAEFALSQLFDRARQTIEPLAAEKGLKLYFFPQDSMLVMKSDFRLLLQILLNVLGNAVKFTEKGSVTVNANLVSGNNEERIAIEVSDTGVGIPADASEAIFDEFYRFHPVDGQPRGSGLGLPITKKLLKHLDGNICLNSIPGKGTTFTFEVPLKYGEKSTKESHRETSEGADAPLSSRTLHTPFPDQGKPFNSSHLSTILVVDDEESFLLSFQSQVSDCYKIITANSGKEALNILNTKSPDLIVLDLVMPDMGGFTLIEMLRKDKRTKRIPIVIYSSKDLDTKEKGLLKKYDVTFVNKGNTNVAELASQFRNIWELFQTRNSS